MSDQAPRPDVVVVGMPSCGKTVFFTVLGKKFTNLVGGRRAAPLGFRLSTCDAETATVVNGAYDRLRSGLWPEATKTGLTMPLRWEVFTGRRRIFELYSMDVAGETFKRAFGVRDAGERDDIGGEKKRRQSKRPKDADGELYQSDAADESGSSQPATAEEKAADNLKSAVATAKVVCFMVNIALPQIRGGRAVAEAELKKLQRFRGSVLNIFLTLRDQRELREKSIIVLTQTHLHEGEIEHAGGPAMYLADVCGGDGAELSNLARECNIPVISVSAINENRETNELPPIDSPGDIPSSGLFGFLLMVSGRVASRDALANVMMAYCEYQRERAEYLRFPALEIKSRLQLARRYADASEKYVAACAAYLSNPVNFCEKGGGDSLAAADMKLYERCSKDDYEIKSATDRVYLVRDEQWDIALRKAAVLKCNRNGQETRTSEICSEVLTGMSAALPGKTCNAANQEFVFGFGEDELLSGAGPSSYGEWVAINVGEYWDDLKGDIRELTESHAESTAAVKELINTAGTDRFAVHLRDAESKRNLQCEKIEALNKNWPGLDDSQVLNATQGVDSLALQIIEAQKRHEKALADQERARRMKEIESGLQSLGKEVEAEKESLHNVERTIGTDDFDKCVAELERLHAEVDEHIKSAHAKWEEEYGLSVSGLSMVESDWKSINYSPRLKDARDGHMKALTEQEYERRMEEIKGGVERLRSEVEKEQNVVGRLEQAIGRDEFNSSMIVAVNAHDKVGKSIQSASHAWQKVYGLSVPELPELESEWNGLANKITEARKRDADVRAQKKRRIRLLALVAVVITVVALTISIRSFYLECNHRLYEAIKSLCEQGELQDAVDAYGEMYEIPLYGVSREKYFAPGFDKRLADVAGINDARLRVAGLRDQLTKIESADDFAKLRLPVRIAESIAKAHRMISDCSASSAEFSFDALRLGSAPIDAERQRLAECETMLRELLPAVDLACQDARLDILCDKADAFLKTCEAEIAGGDDEAAVTALDKAEGTIGGALPHKGCSDAIKRHIEETKGKVTQLGARLKAAKVNSLIGSAREHANARRWDACKEDAGKALVIDPSNSDAASLKMSAERAISARKDADQADNESRRAMTDAMLNDAPKWAEKEWSLAEKKRNAAKVKYEAGEYSDASDLFWESKNAYVEAGEAAKENSVPKVKIVAKLNGAVKNATITSGVTLNDYDEMFSGRKTDGTIVLLKNREVGELHEFKIEYEENVTRYVGSGLYRVEKGLNEFVIDLKYKDTLKWNRRRCGHCGTSLEGYPHVYKCPKCLGVIKDDAFEK